MTGKGKDYYIHLYVVSHLETY